MIRLLHLGASVSLIALIMLCVAWELWLAPLKTGGSMLVLKVLPLLVPLFGILRGKRYTFQWASMLILLYFTEGTVRAWSEHGLSAKLAGLEIILSLVFFGCAIFYAKWIKNHSNKSLGSKK
ncbi:MULTISPECIES: DUF2069 domain-containing protein [unclassified Methylotenera]|uniref:DUF2069 domain-containing protein n=1 Tax=unclassified Methylotenera TaxID=2643294 RepID=UPI000477DF36|nr:MULTISPECIES: DUF2069 domain-containing protein [unclassified Methylotenera]